MLEPEVVEVSDPTEMPDIKLTPQKKVSLPAPRLKAKPRAKAKTPYVKLYRSLINMYNDHWDFAVKVSDTTWGAVEWPKYATHKIVCTIEHKAEDEEPDFNARRPHKDSSKIEGFAEAVAAIPLRRELKSSKLKITRPLPKAVKNWPPYRVDYSLKKKRKCLGEYARQTGCHRRYWPRIREFDSATCDAWLKEFVRASRYLREENRLKNKGKLGFWDKLKLKEEKKKAPEPVRKQGLLEKFTKDERKAIGHALTEVIKARQIVGVRK